MHNKKTRSAKAWLVVMAVLLTLLAAGGTTLAILLTKTNEVENTFTPSNIEISVEEKFNGEVKENVTIQNTGDIAAYIRAAVVINWKDANGNVLGLTPVAGTDYTVEWGHDDDEGSKWFSADGFYYYADPVEKGGKTGKLINKITALQTKKVDEVTYYLNVEILASGIQTVPTAAVEEAWPAVKVSTEEATKGQLVEK